MILKKMCLLGLIDATVFLYFLDFGDIMLFGNVINTIIKQGRLSHSPLQIMVFSFAATERVLVSISQVFPLHT